MQQLASFTHRNDPSVPSFDDEGFITVMDANCSLCAKGARWIARNDRNHAFRIIPLQSPLGAALMRHHGMDPDDPLSWLFLDQGRAYTSLDAFIRVGGRLGGIWKSLAVLRLIPERLQNKAYSWVARNRYRLFGRTDMCAMPHPEVKKRLLM